jgi:hypothetical protein
MPYWRVECAVQDEQDQKYQSARCARLLQRVTKLARVVITVPRLLGHGFMNNAADDLAYGGLISKPVAECF